jgi:hypothetical protein
LLRKFEIIRGGQSALNKKKKKKKKEEGRRKKEEGRRKKEEGRRKKEEGRMKGGICDGRVGGLREWGQLCTVCMLWIFCSEDTASKLEDSRKV